MCAVDQLEFTERPPHSLSALFPPRPSPVQLYSMARTAGSPAIMGERLALAVRLARRDLHHSLAGRERFNPSVHMPVQIRPQASSECGLEPRKPPVRGRGEMSTESQAPACTRSGNGGDKEREGEGGGRREERRGEDKRKEEDTELLCLKKALAQQVQRLQELCANEEEKVEQEEENERERRVAAEHVAAMARKLYDLQRQVIMNDGGGGDKGGDLQGKKLAAARRAVTRTLHTFSSTRQSLPNQLLQLVGKLCRDRQSSELLALAQSYSDALTAARHNSMTPQQSMKPKAGIKQKGRRVAQRLNHIHAPGGLKTHSSEPTYSSSAKQQRTVLSSGTKTTSHSHRSSTANPKGRSIARRRQKAGGNRRKRTGEEAAEVKQGFGSHEDSEGHKATQVTVAMGPDFSSPPVISPSSPLPESQPQCQSPTGSVPSVDTQGSGAPQPSTGPLQDTSHSSLLPQGELPHLVATLMRMEEEELMICKKWNPTPQTPQTPPLTVQSTGTRGDAQDHPRRDRGGQDGSGAQWTPLEILADCLLEEAVCDVCSEMADACDSLANSLFFPEFLLPPTTSRS